MHERRYGAFKLSAGLAQLLCLCWTWCLSDLLLSAGLHSAGERGWLWEAVCAQDPFLSPASGEFTHHLLGPYFQLGNFLLNMCDKM